MATAFLSRFQRDKSEKNPLLNKDQQKQQPQQTAKDTTDILTETGNQIKQNKENRNDGEETGGNHTINAKQRRRRSYVFATLKDVIALANNEDAGATAPTISNNACDVKKDISKNVDSKQSAEIDLKKREIKKDKREEEESQQQQQQLQPQPNQQPRPPRRYMRSATAASVTQLLSDGCNNLLQRFRRNPSERPEPKSQQQQQREREREHDREREREKQQQQKLNR